MGVLFVTVIGPSDSWRPSTLQERREMHTSPFWARMEAIDTRTGALLASQSFQPAELTPPPFEERFRSSSFGYRVEVSPDLLESIRIIEVRLVGR
jgi:hypothetical protein